MQKQEATSFLPILHPSSTDLAATHASTHACALTRLALGLTAAHAAAVVPAVLLAGVVQELRLHGGGKVWMSGWAGRLCVRGAGQEVGRGWHNVPSPPLGYQPEGLRGEHCNAGTL